MKKYFLLATVAGCFMASNAVAGTDTIAEGGKSANIKLKVDFSLADTITDVTHMDFGNIVVLNDEFAEHDVIATLTPAGVVTVGDDTKLYAHTSRTPAAGSFTVSGIADIDNIEFACADNLSSVYTPNSETDVTSCFLPGSSGLTFEKLTGENGSKLMKKKLEQK